MGHKINPVSFRLGVNRGWNAFWYGDLEYSNLIQTDISINKLISTLCGRNKFPTGIPLIKRWLDATMQISTAFYNSKTIEATKHSKYKKFLNTIHNNAFTKALLHYSNGCNLSFRKAKLAYTGNTLHFTIPVSCSQIVASYMAYEFRKRNPFKEVVQDIMDWVHVSKYILGMHISCSGRFTGENRTRTLWKKHNKIPYSTLNAHVDFAKAIAISKFGAIGIKVWVYYNPEIINLNVRGYEARLQKIAKKRKSNRVFNKHITKLTKIQNFKKIKKKQLFLKIRQHAIKSKKN
jgi:small subunit ribosomal protein S3